ncbi:MAG TPA: hypothetical protein VK402_05835 [Blastococcus sp.]|nr:hypothetical protein [Blastococcus sp.]
MTSTERDLTGILPELAALVPPLPGLALDDVLATVYESAAQAA